MHYDCCFGGQIRTRAVSAKQMTMVSPIQLLLFASRTVTAQGPNQVQLDNWSVTLSVCLPACPSACLSVCWSICSLHPALSQHRVPTWHSWITDHSCCLSVCMSICLFVCLPVYLLFAPCTVTALSPSLVQLDNWLVMLSSHLADSPSVNLSFFLFG